MKLARSHFHGQIRAVKLNWAKLILSRSSPPILITQNLHFRDLDTLQAVSDEIKNFRRASFVCRSK